MIIDAFKTGLFEKLRYVNNDIKAIFNIVCVEHNGQPYYRQEPTRELSHWFDINRLTTIPLPKHYPDIIPLNFNPKFCLLENYPNYVSMFLIDLLYGDRKDTTVIEDVCCGQGKLAYYLSRLGFKQFSMVDNFSQIRPELLHETMKFGKINYKLNEPPEIVRPTIINQVSYPTKVREVASTVEMICVYSIVDWVRELPQFKELCTDSDDMLTTYVRADKYDEFRHKLKPFVVG